MEPASPIIDASSVETHAEAPLPGHTAEHIYVLSAASPDAGRSHVIAAMAKSLAQRTGATIHEYYDLNRYSLGKTSDWDAFWKDKPQPDILFEDGMYFYAKQVKDKDVFMVRRDRYEGWMQNPPSHFLFTDSDAEIAKFEQAYPNLKRPLIAVCLAAPEGAFIKDTIANIAARYQEATIFVTSSPRTDAHDLKHGLAVAQLKINDMNRPGINLLHYAYDPTHQSYNPHIGLLKSADAAVIVGDSRSMLADALATNTTAYTTGWKSPKAPSLNDVAGKLPIEPRVRYDGTAGMSKQLQTDYEEWKDREKFQPVTHFAL